PNPTSGKATISFNSTSKTKYLVKVTDMIGNAVFTEVVNAFEGYNTREIDLTKIAKGVYVISLSTEDMTTESIRLIVQ
ncbi:MAG: T9SS type A sorting domain-containing protein, partial [Bacteroidia bacterium]|nr:T9SS type A sorting domain-containing protein [Bacteroidia bacterium]